ncbi:MSHA biogenesis protein MshJ [Shewanella sp.]|uniref:MSHA biogenesis protein MshJ n=1 Tax=Shewanella sp. TaxID=50422 RepID=UPI0035670065
MSRIAALGSRYESLTSRERGIIFGASLLGLFLLLSTPLESLWKEAGVTRQRLADVTQTNKLSGQQISMYREQLAQDPNRDHLQRKQLLLAEHAKVDKALSDEMVDMVPADRMPSVLSTMLDGAQGLKLTSFESIAPVPLLDLGEQTTLNLYSHGMSLTLEGDFFAVLRFVQTVESMEQQLYWKRLDYQVKAYPRAEVQLLLHTLSINEDFIRVANH